MSFINDMSSDRGDRSASRASRKFEDKIKDIDLNYRRRDQSNDVRIRNARAIIDNVTERTQQDIDQSDQETVKEFEMS